jgi:hypothetical protein
MNELVFIITRCVRKEEHNRLYKECYRCIRKFYDNPIYIIDDNSDKNILDNIDMSGVYIIDSEFPGLGEVLPYYYMYHRRLGKKALILHDSMFIQQKLQLDDVMDYRFLWHFNNSTGLSLYIDSIREVYSNLNNYEELYDVIHEYKWSGCFGGCMIISLDFLIDLQESLGLFNIIDSIKTREERSMFERLLGICVYHMRPLEISSISLFGDIHEHTHAFSLTYNEYIHNSALDIRHPVVKVWSGR